MENSKWRWQLAQYLEIRWWQQYLRKKDPKQYLRQKAAYWKRILNALEIRPQEQAHVWDAGCGPSGIYSVLQAQRVAALDPLLDQYRQRIPHFDPADYPWVQFYCGKLEESDWKNTFDLVFCMNAINHVERIELAMDRLVAGCKAGGQIVVGVDAHRYLFLKNLFQWLPGDVLHPQQLDLEDYTHLLEDRNCRIQSRLLHKQGRIFDYWLIVATKRTNNYG